MEKGVARGDANLFLRNVLLRIFSSSNAATPNHDNGKSFLRISGKVFPNLKISIQEHADEEFEFLPVKFSNGGSLYSLEMAGTGILQAIQLIGYATLFRPRLLLLDEPDSHLHPDNQKKLAQVLQEIINEIPDIQIVLATHSRHLLDSLTSINETSFFTVHAGGVNEEYDVDFSSMMLALGALDTSHDDLLRKKAIIVSEDAKFRTDDKHPLRVLLNAAGLNPSDCVLLSCESVDNLHSVIPLAHFLRDRELQTPIIIQMDRDFLLDQEIDDYIRPRVEDNNLKISLFVTRYSDCEGYFVQPQHVAEVTGDDGQRLVNDCANANHNDLVTKFNAVREALGRKSWARKKIASGSQFSPRNNSVSRSIPLPPEQIHGKELLAKLHNSETANLVVNSSRLDVSDLSEFLRNLNLLT